MIKGILLAAGQSRRLKNENKLIKIFKDKPLIHHALNSAKNSKIKKIIIVLGYQFKEVKKKIKKNKKIIFVHNKNYKNGMSSSIKSGLKKISKKTANHFISVYKKFDSNKRSEADEKADELLKELISESTSKQSR